MQDLYSKITRKLKLGPDTYAWAKDYFGVWHRSKVGILVDAIDSYSDSICPNVFHRHLKEYTNQFGLNCFADMRDLLLYVSSIADKEGFF